MGGSSSKEGLERKEQIEEAYRRHIERTRLATALRDQIAKDIKKLHAERQLERHLNRLSLHEVTKTLQLLNDLREAFGLDLLESYPSNSYQETYLDKSSTEYNDVSSKFKHDGKPLYNFTISKISKVNNTFHVLQYHLMKNKYQCVYEHFGQEVLMYHGTKTSNLNGICTYNFDRSKVQTHKFGFGTSFAKDCLYATHYHQDNKNNPNKVMVLAKVYYGTVQQGKHFTTIPDEPCYTSTNQSKTVIVKYDDATAYPVYIIYYTGLHRKYVRLETDFDTDDFYNFYTDSDSDGF